MGRKNWRREVIMKGEGGGRKGGVVNKLRDKVKLVSIYNQLAVCMKFPWKPEITLKSTIENMYLAQYHLEN